MLCLADKLKHSRAELSGLQFLMYDAAAALCLNCLPSKLCEHFSYMDSKMSRGALQVDECYNLVPVGFDGFVDDADVTEITMLDDLISSVCAGESAYTCSYICRWLFARACTFISMYSWSSHVSGQTLLHA